MAPSVQRLQQFAIWISVVSIIYNGAEGGISIAFGAETSSRSLVFFGIQSGIEVISAAIVLWRFLKVSKPGEESKVILPERELKFERFATFSIGILLLILGLGTEASAIVSLVLHEEPESSTPSLIISASALVIMIFIWLPKRYLARALNSSAMQGEATCSLSCIQITFVLFVGSLIFRVWKGGWWLDGATSIVLGLLFSWEGIKMIRWARDPKFDGGCCSDCHNSYVEGDHNAEELGERYRDICECCAEKEECKVAEDCQCATCNTEPGVVGTPTEAETNCCPPRDGQKCCTREVLTRRQDPANAPAPETPQQTVPVQSPAEQAPQPACACCSD